MTTGAESQTVTNAVNSSESLPEENCKKQVSPMVGTFYTQPSPDKPPFVKVGDKVKKGQTLCIIEAMKLMNEIECEHDGEVIKILTQNEAMVEYGQPLFLIK
jgi:acetyl-CoA carboxylase biotin carboxyl carrier protein